ncbi:unnamed protein product [Cladocopium goreaui]|uniref:Uncharacterized protein n=1 Tax=Cladocopium goreaui TaxID=2562237 RepID=A0A9P1FI17_9DINO|nr:unnamed protein product [Cladocopium goreaui]|mmetsp:Transcript_4383/g.10174  ORF Transcript_4383/g.10174 Transcript_4383/m.10174 type:complete len:195 (-) Transcript_4383:41-625(-)
MADALASLSFQVLVIGSRSSGKSSFVRAAWNESSDHAAGEESADGVQIRKVTSLYSTFSTVVDFLEMPAEDRYVPLLPHFGGSAACIALVVNIADPHGHTDLCNRLAALGAPAPCGLLVVQGSLPASAASGEERRRLEPLRDVAARWGLKFLRFESLEQMEKGRLLHAVCDLVLGDVPDGADPIHLVGRRVTRN